MGELVLVRHGETEWSRSGQHTGTTDLPLTERGRAQSGRLREVLHGRRFARVVVSPLRRARETAELADLMNLGPMVEEPDLVEWDYGGYEGLTTPEISEQLGRPWTVFSDGVVPGKTPGESLEDVAARARAALDRVRPLLDGEDDVALVGHGHQLRILLTQYLGLAPAAGALFVLDAGTVSRLGRYHGEPAVVTWNVDVDEGLGGA